LGDACRPKSTDGNYSLEGERGDGGGRDEWGGQRREGEGFHLEGGVNGPRRLARIKDAKPHKDRFLTQKSRRARGGEGG